MKPAHCIGILAGTLVATSLWADDTLPSGAIVTTPPTTSTAPATGATGTGTTGAQASQPPRRPSGRRNPAGQSASTPKFNPGFTQHIDASGTWKDPGSGATLSCAPGCTVSVGTDAKGQPAYKVEFGKDAAGNDVAGMAIINSPDKTVSLLSQSSTAGLVANEIASGKGGAFQDGSVLGGLTNSSELKLDSGVVSTMTLGANRYSSLPNGATLSCTHACRAQYGSDGNVQVVALDAREEGKLVATISGSPKAFDLTRSAVTGKVTYRVPVNETLELNMTTFISGPVVNNVPGGQPAALTNGLALSSCGGYCNISVGADNSTEFKISDTSGSALFKGGARMSCDVSCTITEMADGSVKVRLTGDVSKTHRFLQLHGIEGSLPVTVEWPDGSTKAWNFSAPAAGSATVWNPLFISYETSADTAGTTVKPMILGAAAGQDASGTTSIELGAGGNYTLGNGVKVACTAACKVVMDAQGRMQVIMLNGGDASQVNITGGSQPVFVMVQTSAGSNHYNVDAKAAVSFGNNSLPVSNGTTPPSGVSTLSAHALSTVVRLPADGTHTLASGLAVKCTAACEVWINDQGRLQVSMLDGDDTARVFINGGESPMIVSVTTASGTNAYEVPGKAVATIGKSGLVGDSDAKAITTTQASGAAKVWVTDADGNSIAMHAGVAITCSKDCHVVWDANGNPRVSMADAYAEDARVVITTANGPLDVTLGMGGSTRTYRVDPNTTVTYDAAATKDAGSRLIGSTTDMNLFKADGLFDGVPNERRAAMRTALQRLAGSDALLRAYARLNGLDENLVAQLYGPGSVHARQKYDWLAMILPQGPLQHLMQVDAYTDGQIVDEEDPDLAVGLLIYLADLARLGFKPNENTNPDGSSSLLGSTAGIAVGDWAAVVAVASEHTSVNSVDPDVTAGASHGLAADGSLASFRAGPLGTDDQGSTTTSSGCLLVQCTQPEVIRWGVWNSGTAVMSAGTAVNVTTSNILHYIIGSATDPAVIAGRTGNVTFNPIGGTVPTGSDGRTWTATTGSMAITFNGTTSPTGTLSSYALTPNSGSGYSFSSISLTGSPASGAVTLFGTDTDGTANLTVHGTFFGATGNQIGAAMNVVDGASIKVNSVQVFKAP